MLEKSSISWRNNSVYSAAQKYLTTQRKPSTKPGENWYKSEIASPWGVTYYTFAAPNRTEAYTKARNWATRVANHIKSMDPTRVIPYTLFLVDDSENPGDQVVMDYCADVTFIGWYARANDTGSAEHNLVVEGECA